LICCLFFFVFFFSSRRRHTRSLRDWSSDVCSSDLTSFATRPSPARILPSTSSELASSKTCASVAPLERSHSQPVTRRGRSNTSRSEERRVGKECRDRWWPEQ